MAGRCLMQLQLCNVFSSCSKETSLLRRCRLLLTTYRQNGLQFCTQPRLACSSAAPLRRRHWQVLPQLQPLLAKEQTLYSGWHCGTTAHMLSGTGRNTWKCAQACTTRIYWPKVHFLQQTRKESQHIVHNSKYKWNIYICEHSEQAKLFLYTLAFLQIPLAIGLQGILGPSPSESGWLQQQQRGIFIFFTLTQQILVNKSECKVPLRTILVYFSLRPWHLADRKLIRIFAKFCKSVCVCVLMRNAHACRTPRHPLPVCLSVSLTHTHTHTQIQTKSENFPGWQNWLRRQEMCRFWPKSQNRDGRWLGVRHGVGAVLLCKLCCH